MANRRIAQQSRRKWSSQKVCRNSFAMRFVDTQVTNVGWFMAEGFCLPSVGRPPELLF
jgi:hypothetical protein